MALCPFDEEKIWIDSLEVLSELGFEVKIINN